MNVAIHSKDRNQAVLSNLFNFYQTAELNINSPYDQYEKAARAYISEYEEDVKQIIDHELDLSASHFKFKDLDKAGKVYWLMSFQNFYRAVNNVINQYDAKYIDNQPAERRYGLDPAPYKYVGHNELEIRPSNSSYHLLF